MRAARTPLHVVTLIDLLAEAGGAEALAVEILLRLDPERFERTLVLYRHVPESSPLHAGQERIVRRLEAAGVRVLRLDARSRHDLVAWRPLVRLLRTGDVDVLHTHKFGPNFWGSLMSRLARRPAFIAHEHTWSFEGRPLRKLVDRCLIATRCAAFLVVSERDRRRMIEVEHIPAGRIRLVANGIPAPEPDPASDVRALFGVPPGVPLIGSVGVYRAQKDLGTLMEAHAIVRRRRPDARLVLVGDGVERPQLEAHRARLGLTEHVVLTGFRTDAPSLAAGFDVAVNSSLFEGASLAILEWMALGLPIVATAVGGTPELLDGGRAGSLVPSGDPAALAAAIEALLDDPERAAQLGALARERQHEHYDIDGQVRRLEALYEELARR